jgi:hypothetical protein
MNDRRTSGEPDEAMGVEIVKCGHRKIIMAPALKRNGPSGEDSAFFALVDCGELFNGHRFCQIARLIDIRAFPNGGIICQ